MGTNASGPLEVQMSDESPIENAVRWAMAAERHTRFVEHLRVEETLRGSVSEARLTTLRTDMINAENSTENAVRMSTMWAAIANAAANNGLEDWTIGQLGNFDGSSPGVGIDTEESESEHGSEEVRTMEGSARVVSVTVTGLRRASAPGSHGPGCLCGR